MEKIRFDFAGQTDGTDFFVLEQTRLNEVNYLLVTDSEQGDGEAWILKDLSEAEAEDALYEIVEEEEELRSISAIFSEMLEDIELM